MYAVVGPDGRVDTKTLASTWRGAWMWAWRWAGYDHAEAEHRMPLEEWMMVSGREVREVEVRVNGEAPPEVE